jgi:hypothetical protein
VETENSVFCYVKTVAGPMRRVLQLGDSNDSFIVVIAGLKEGEQVVLNAQALTGEDLDKAIEPIENVRASGPEQTETDNVN